MFPYCFLKKRKTVCACVYICSMTATFHFGSIKGFLALNAEGFNLSTTRNRWDFNINTAQEAYVGIRNPLFTPKIHLGIQKKYQCHLMGKYPPLQNLLEVQQAAILVWVLTEATRWLLMTKIHNRHDLLSHAGLVKLIATLLCCSVRLQMLQGKRKGSQLPSNAIFAGNGFSWAPIICIICIVHIGPYHARLLAWCFSPTAVTGPH